MRNAGVMAGIARRRFSRPVPAAVLVIVLLIAGMAAAVAAETAIGSAGAGPLREFTRTDPPLPVPDFAFTDKTGAVLSLADFKGKVVLLNIWATWCAPCVKELPALDRLQAKLARDDATVIALSIDRGGLAQVARFFDRLEIRNLAIHLDPQSRVWRALKVKALPLTLLIDPAGREVGRIEGAAEWDAQEAVALIRSYITP